MSPPSSFQFNGSELRTYDTQRVYKDPKTGRSLGSGYVRFATIEQAIAAVNTMNGSGYDLRNSPWESFGNLCAGLMVE